MKSNFLSLNARDFLHGLFIAVTMAVLTTIGQLVEAWNSSTGTDISGLFSHLNLQLVVKVAIGAAITYILKNWLQNGNGQLFKKDENSITGSSNLEAVKSSPVAPVDANAVNQNTSPEQH